MILTMINRLVISSNVSVLSQHVQVLNLCILEMFICLTHMEWSNCEPFIPMIDNGWHYHYNKLYMSLCMILTMMNRLVISSNVSVLSQCLYQLAACTGAELCFLHSGNVRSFDPHEKKSWAIYPYDW